MCFVFACKRKNVKRQLGRKVKRNVAVEIELMGKESSEADQTRKKTRPCEMVVSYTTGQSRLARCHDGLGRPPPRKQWGHRPLALRAIMGLPSTPRPRGSPAGALVKTQEGLAVVPRAAIGPGGRGRLARRSNRGHVPRFLGSCRLRLNQTTDDRRGSDRSPHSRWNQQARLCGGRSTAETAKAVKRGRRQRRGIRGSMTCQCDVHQRPRRPSRFAWCGWKWMGGSSQGKLRGRGTQGQRRGRRTRRRQCRW